MIHFLFRDGPVREAVTFRSPGHHVGIRGEVVSEIIQNSAKCIWLERLFVSFCSLTDRDLRPLKNAKHLRELTVFSFKNTDQSLKVMANIETLEVLQFLFTRVSDSGIRELARLPRLRAFRVTPGRVSNQGRTWIKENLRN